MSRCLLPIDQRWFTQRHVFKINNEESIWAYEQAQARTTDCEQNLKQVIELYNELLMEMFINKNDLSQSEYYDYLFYYMCRQSSLMSNTEPAVSIFPQEDILN